MGEHAFQRRAVILKAPGGHGNIPPAAAAVPDKGSALCRRKLAFGHRPRRAVKLHRALSAGKLCGGIAEHIVLKKLQRGVFALSCGEYLLPHLNALLLRRLRKPPGGYAAESESLAVGIAGGQAHRQLRAGAHKRLDDPPLLSGEIYKSVYVNVQMLFRAAFVNDLRQLCQRVGGVSPAVGHNGVISPRHQSDILQLVAQPAAAFRRRAHQLLRGQAGGLKLVHLA